MNSESESLPLSSICEKFQIEKQCNWIFQLIQNSQKEPVFRKAKIQIWRMKRLFNKQVKVTCYDYNGTKILQKKVNIEKCTFIGKELVVANNTIMFPQEYKTVNL